MKPEIIEKLIVEQEQVIKDHEKAINARNEAADIDEEDTRDTDEFAQQELNKDFVRRFRDQLVTAHDDLAILKSFKFRKNDTFAPGALVVTDEYYFLIGAAVHNVEHDGKQVVCISTQAPVYGLNEGKKKGDEMKMGNKTTKIKSIH